MLNCILFLQDLQLLLLLLLLLLLGGHTLPVSLWLQSPTTATIDSLQVLLALSYDRLRRNVSLLGVAGAGGLLQL